MKCHSLSVVPLAGLHLLFGFIWFGSVVTFFVSVSSGFYHTPIRVPVVSDLSMQRPMTNEVH
jgi:hypothetical protein